MTLLDVSKLDAVGAPLYDMRKIFQIDAPASKISFSLITIHPGSRVPEVGDGFHSGDEYSYFLEGEVYTVSGDDVGTVGAGMATLIPVSYTHLDVYKRQRPARPDTSLPLHMVVRARAATRITLSGGSPWIPTRRTTY